MQPISSKEAVEIMKSAYNTSNQEIKNHLKNEQNLYSNKRNPDFNNSCLESIKAVEAICSIVFSNQKILNLREFKKTGKYNQHIIAVLENLDIVRGDVIAHATKSRNYLPNRKDAILTHTLCCGFINYLQICTK